MGTYPTNIKLGEQQNLNFVDGDVGPFWLNNETKEATKYDTDEGTIITKELTKVDLLIALRQDGYNTTKKRFLKPQLIELYKQRNIATNKTEQNIIHGWLGQPKGMLQVLFERGYIDITKVLHPRSMIYSKSGKTHTLRREW